MTRRARRGRAAVAPAERASLGGAQGSPRPEGSPRGSVPTGTRSARSRGARKEPLSICIGEPYYKPTQVGKPRRHRRTEELALRNSAKWVRNLGRSTAGGEARRPQRNGPCDCLPKTQAHANRQREVYGLTPARCWKVKGSRQP